MSKVYFCQVSVRIYLVSSISAMTTASYVEILTCSFK